MMLEMQNPEDSGGGVGGSGFVDMLCTEEMECKICYCAYNLGSRRPKVLECCHRLCSKCLIKILDLGESLPNALVCPFCRYLTRLPGEAVSNLSDDSNLVAKLALQNRNQRNRQFHQEATTELLLSPMRLSSLMSNIHAYQQIHGSHLSNQDYHSSSLDSMASIAERCTVWNCAALLCQTSARALVWVLGLLYFSSLPMGVYLLIMQRTTLGVLLVSLVPASLIVIMVYGFCQCICHEFWDCLPS
uniref:E3 ubiquitin-protein ligase RNF182 n=1 Tax=Oreochromis aureus TaxID=47969 RepID=A0A668U590_OREAU